MVRIRIGKNIVKKNSNISNSKEIAVASNVRMREEVTIKLRKLLDNCFAFKIVNLRILTSDGKFQWVENEDACKKQCAEEGRCNFLSYHYSSQNCFLYFEQYTVSSGDTDEFVSCYNTNKNRGSKKNIYLSIFLISIFFYFYNKNYCLRRSKIA